MFINNVNYNINKGKPTKVCLVLQILSSKSTKK